MSWDDQREMTPREYQRTLVALGINPGQAARWLGISNRTSYRYRDGETEIPVAHALLLRFMVVAGFKPNIPPYVKGRY